MTRVIVTVPSKGSTVVKTSGPSTPSVVPSDTPFRTRVFEDEGPPTLDTGLREGDVYLDTLTGDLYRWEA
jgi:hypothetical protein